MVGIVLRIAVCLGVLGLQKRFVVAEKKEKELAARTARDCLLTGISMRICLLLYTELGFREMILIAIIATVL